MIAVRRLPIAPRCGFGLCQETAEAVVQQSATAEPILTCLRHVVPAISWGVVADVETSSEWLHAHPQQLLRASDSAA